MKTTILLLSYLATALMLRAVPEDLSTAHEKEREPINSVAEHMAACPPSEVRLLYFLGDSIGARMVMTIDLNKYTVYTVRDISDHALQSSKTRELSHDQIEKVKAILKELPSSNEAIPEAKSLLLAFWLEGKLVNRKYPRESPPSQIDRLYDIGGGHLAKGTN